MKTTLKLLAVFDLHNSLRTPIEGQTLWRWVPPNPWTDYLIEYCGAAERFKGKRIPGFPNARLYLSPLHRLAAKLATKDRWKGRRKRTKALRRFARMARKSTHLAEALTAYESIFSDADDPNDPALRALARAPLDDEPETDEERTLVAEARAESDRGEGVSHAVAKKMLGL